MESRFYCVACSKEMTHSECEAILEGDRYEDFANDPLPYLGVSAKETEGIEECSDCIRYRAYMLGECMEEIFPISSKDVQDAEYTLCSTTNRELTIVLRNKKLVLHGEDSGRECKNICGKDSYEFVYELDEKQTYKLLSALRLQEANKSIEDVLQQAFGGEDGSVRFEKYCKAEKIDYRFFSF